MTRAMPRVNDIYIKNIKKNLRFKSIRFFCKAIPKSSGGGRGAGRGRGPCKEMPLPCKYLIKVTYCKEMPLPWPPLIFLIFN